jgi:predicted metalloprotease with PDZ domain
MKVRTIVSLLLLPVLLVGTSCAQKKEKGKDVVVTVKKSTKQGYLGVQISDMTAKIGKEKNLKATSGALVTSVVEDSPAEKAAIKDEDVIIEFAGKEVSDADDLITVVGETKPGTKVNVVVMRGDERKTLQVEVGKAPKEQGLAYSVVPPLTTPRGRFLWDVAEGRYFGLRLQDLNKQLGEYFETPDGRGVLVTEVPKESAGEKAGFKAGDVIIKVGKESIRRAADIQYALEDVEEGSSAEVTVLRKGKQLTLTVEVKDAVGGVLGPDFRLQRYRGTPENLESLFEFKVQENGNVLKLDTDELKEAMKKLKGETETLQQKLRGNLKDLKIRIIHEGNRTVSL